MNLQQRTANRWVRGVLWLGCAAGAIVPGATSACGAEMRVDGKTFTLPDGFTIERVAGPPLVDRPVVADFDEQGRLYVADSSGSGAKLDKQLVEKPHRVVRLESTKGDGHFDKQVVFADRLMFPEGAMWFSGSLYVSGVPSIWKLTDTNNDSVADQRSEWFQGKTLTGCGNDLHGPYLGPDGWIYWCKGAFAEQTYERPGHKPFVTRAAHLFRARPDGSGIEPVMTGGMDNPVHIVFTPGGERLFTTTFLQHPAGGKRDGIIHAIYGGVYGKIHDVIDGHPRTSPDVMPVLVHLGPAACCGLLRYESEAFGGEYRDNLFATCFNLRKVTRHVLTPDGSTFSTRDEDFLVCDSLDFHPTEVLEDADGSLLVIDTGGWYKLCCPTSQIGKPDVLGAIYRVRRTGATSSEDPRGLKLAWASLDAPALAKLLDDPRPAVRKRAIQAMADRGDAALPALLQVMSGGGSVLARINATWAATRIAGSPARAAVRQALKDSDETVRQVATHASSVWRDHESLQALIEQLAGSSAHNRRAAAEALGRIGDARAVLPLLAALEKPADRVLDHSLTFALIEIADPKVTAAGLNSTNPQVRRSALIALDQMEGGNLQPGAVAAELTSPESALRETAGWVAAHHPEWGAQIAEALQARIVSKMSDGERAQLQHQLAHLAHSQPIQDLLARTLSDETSPEPQRRLALGAMGEANLKQVPASWVKGLANVLARGDAALFPDAITAARKLPWGEAGSPEITEPLLKVASRNDVPEPVRLEALSAVPGGAVDVSPELFRFLTAHLALAQPATQRLSAAQVLSRAKLDSEQLSDLADSVKTAGPLEIDRLLAAFQQSSDDVVGKRLVSALQGSKAAASLKSESVRPRLEKFGPDVQKQAESFLARLNPDAGKQKARLDQLQATLPKGDVRRGQLVFNSAKAACSSCHAIGYVGGNVGPDLTSVGAIRAERDLLESIVFPSASFVQSFEPVMVDTRSGDRQSGILRRNDAEEVVLVTGPTQEVHIARQDVKEMRPGTVSVMPEGLDQQLAPQELADLVAFLKACK